jgi:hypothetical protein
MSSLLDSRAYFAEVYINNFKNCTLGSESENSINYKNEYINAIKVERSLFFTDLCYMTTTTTMTTTYKPSVCTYVSCS